jgi:hypothetical protein
MSFISPSTRQLRLLETNSAALVLPALSYLAVVVVAACPLFVSAMLLFPLLLSEIHRKCHVAVADCHVQHVITICLFLLSGSLAVVVELVSLHVQRRVATDGQSVFLSVEPQSAVAKPFVSMYKKLFTFYMFDIVLYSRSISNLY